MIESRISSKLVLTAVLTVSMEPLFENITSLPKTVSTAFFFFIRILKKCIHISVLKANTT